MTSVTQCVASGGPRHKGCAPSGHARANTMQIAIVLTSSIKMSRSATLLLVPPSAFPQQLFGTTCLFTLLSLLLVFHFFPVPPCLHASLLCLRGPSACCVLYVTKLSTANNILSPVIKFKSRVYGERKKKEAHSLVNCKKFAGSSRKTLKRKPKYKCLSLLPQNTRVTEEKV